MGVLRTPTSADEMLLQVFARQAKTNADYVES